jgi:hypothetical protein
MSGLLVFLPVAVEDTTRRLALLKATCRTLNRSLILSKGTLPSRLHFQLHLNGVPEPRGLHGSAVVVPALEAAVDAARLVASEAFGDVRVTWDPTSGKTRAINLALKEARRLGCAFLLCVDDDIVVPPEAVGQALETAVAHPHLHAFTAYKAPLVSTHSTAFQRLYSYAFTTSFRHNIYPKRATGSFYCLNVNRISDFPSGCNEGDVLDRVPHVYTGAVVRSPFPPTRAEEVARRVRLELACRTAGYARLHHDPAFLEDVDRRLRLPTSVDKPRYRRALRLSRGIVAEAMQRLKEAQ